MTDHEMKHFPDFKMFVQFVVSDELSKSEPVSPEVLHRRLWSAAQHDIFLRTGGIATMNEEQTGFLRIDDGDYKAAINTGMARLAEAGYLLKTDQQTTQFFAQLADLQVQQRIGDDDQNSFSHLFVDSAHLDIGDRFSCGEGVIQLTPDMTDELIAGVIKYAASISGGKSFVVIPAPTDCVPQTTGEGMSAAVNQFQDHLIGAGGRMVVFDKGHTTFGPLRHLPNDH